MDHLFDVKANGISARNPKMPTIIYGLFKISLIIISHINCWSKIKYVKKCNKIYQKASNPTLRLNFIKFKSNKFLHGEKSKRKIKKINAYSPSSCSSVFNGSTPSLFRKALQNKMTAGKNPAK